MPAQLSLLLLLDRKDLVAECGLGVVHRDPLSGFGSGDRKQVARQAGPDRLPNLLL